MSITELLEMVKFLKQPTHLVKEINLKKWFINKLF